VLKIFDIYSHCRNVKSYYVKFYIKLLILLIVFSLILFLLSFYHYRLEIDELSGEELEERKSIFNRLNKFFGRRRSLSSTESLNKII